MYAFILLIQLGDELPNLIRCVTGHCGATAADKPSAATAAAVVGVGASAGAAARRRKWNRTPQAEQRGRRGGGGTASADVDTHVASDEWSARLRLQQAQRHLLGACRQRRQEEDNGEDFKQVGMRQTIFVG